MATPNSYENSVKEMKPFLQCWDVISRVVVFESLRLVETYLLTKLPLDGVWAWELSY